MSFLTLVNGVVIGFLLLSAIFSFVQLIRGYETKINRNYIFFSFFLSLYVLFTLISNFCTDYNNFIFYDKIITACIAVAGIFFIYLVSYLTNYKPKKILITLEFLIIIQLILNFAIPNGITFGEVTGINKLTYFWGEAGFFPKATISNFLYCQLAVLILVFAFVIKAIHVMYVHGSKENWKVLLVSLTLALTLILLNTFSEVLRYRSLGVLEKLSFISFSVIVMHRNFKLLFLAGQFQKDLKASEERLRLVLDSTNDGVWEWNLNTGENKINSRYAEMLGYDIEELPDIRSNLTKLIHPDEASRIAQLISDLNDCKSKSFQSVFRFKTKDGNWKWLYVRGKVIESDTNGKPIRLIGTNVDIDDQMRIKTKLEESEKRYRILAESTFEGIGITENGIMIDCNEALCQMLKYSSDELIGKNYQDFIAQESKNTIDNFLGKRSFHESYKLLAVKKDGTNFPIEVRTNTIELDGKQFQVSAIRDISQQLKFEKEIINRENTLRNIIDSAPFGAHTYKLNAKGILVLSGYNKNADLLLNINHAKLIGKTIAEAFPSLGITQVPHIYKKVATEGIIYSDDQTLYNGNTILGIFDVKAIKTGNDQVTVFFRDITETKRALENLRASEEKFRLLAENSTDLISRHDSDGNFIYVSPSSKNLLGYEPTELVGKSPFEYFHPDDVKIVRESLKKILTENVDAEVTLYRFRHKLGNYVWFETISKTIRDEHTNAIIEIHTTSRDVGERIQYQQELKINADNLNKIFNATPIPLVLESLAPSIQVIYVNDAACKFIGKEREEILGKMLVGGIPDSIENHSTNSPLKEGDEYDFETSIMIEDKVKYAIVYIRIINYSGKNCALSAILDITDRKLAQEANITSERKLSTAMKIAKLGHWEYDVSQKQFTFNEEFYRMLRTNVEKIGSYKLSAAEYAERFIPSEEQYIVEEEIIKALNADDLNYSNQVEHRVIFGDGNLGYINVRFNVIKDDFGQTVKLYGVNQDITERKIADEENTRRKYLIDQLLDTVPDIIYFKDNQSRFLEISQSFAKRLQIKSRDEIIGKTDFDIFDNKHATDAFNDEQSIISSGRAIISKIEKELWHGLDERWALTTKMPLKNSKGEIIGTFGISRDITESKKAEEELRSAMHYIEYVINSIPVAILSIDNDDFVTQYNKAAEKFLNSSVPEDERRLSKKFPDLKMIDELLDKSRAQKNLVTDVITVADEDGEAKMFSASVFPLVTASSTGSVIMIEDITNRRKMEQVLIQSEKMLSVAGLAAGMAHEINNPLGTISQGCQNLARRSSSILPKNYEVARRLGIEMEKIEAYFRERQLFEIMESMQGAVEKAAEIIKSMLQFSRRSESKKVQYSLKKIVEEVIDLAYNDYDLKKKFNFRSFKIIKEYEEFVPDVLITITELQQVVYNIVQNAAHAIRLEDNPGKLPTLIFRLSKEAKYVRLEIEDNGPGIKEKIKNRIFEPFFTTKEVGEGTGLGLSVSYMIITHNHNGLLTVESIVSKGTKFIIELPYLDRT